MTLTDLIFKRAVAYPDRDAIVYADGRRITYAELRSVWTKIMPDPTGVRRNSTGTTGLIKTNTMSDDKWQKNIARYLTPECGFVSVSKFFMTTPMAGRYSYVFGAGATLYEPGTCSDASEWLAMCERERVEGFFFFPKLRWCREHMEAMIAAASPFRFNRLYLSGGPVTAEEVARWNGLIGGGQGTYVFYGTSESGAIAAGPFNPASPACVGAVHRDVTVRIDDDGQIGVLSPSMVDGHDGKLRDGYFYSGDKGHFEDGQLVIEGRG